MIYYESHNPHPSRLQTPSATRLLTLLSLGAYPMGTILRALNPDGRNGLIALDLAGLALILVAFVAAWPIIGSHVQRIVAGPVDTLDEFELTLRQRALAQAYSTFSALVLVAVFYCGVASDFDLWLPRGHEEFNAIFWAVFLYAVLLPAALLAWSKDVDGLA